MLLIHKITNDYQLPFTRNDGPCVIIPRRGKYATLHKKIIAVDIHDYFEIWGIAWFVVGLPNECITD